MHKMKDKPGHVRPENGFYAKHNAIKFVPQTELSREQTYWLNCQDHTPSKPVTPFVRKGPPPSQVLASLHLVKINRLKDQLQGKDETIRNLKAQHDIVSLLNVGPTDGRKALETELTQLKDTITALRIQNDGFKVTNATQKTKIAKLKAKDVGNKSSGTTTPNNLKVLAPGMYAIGIKSATGASKTASKNHSWIYRKLPAKSTSGDKVKDHPRNLNKQNPIDSHLNAKEPLELSPSVSSSSNVTMLSRFADCQLSDRKAGSKGISAIFE
nr:hypothetical protein [Tanacetum cinerariifolium]